MQPLRFTTLFAGIRRCASAVWDVVSIHRSARRCCPSTIFGDRGPSKVAYRSSRIPRLVDEGPPREVTQ